jgi:hypothetical protein
MFTGMHRCTPAPYAVAPPGSAGDIHFTELAFLQEKQDFACWTNTRKESTASPARI